MGDPTTLIDPAAHYHLGNWARWMRNYDVGIGYKHKSAGFSSGRTGDTIEDWEEDGLRHEARISDAVIGSMEVRYQAAIYNVYLASVWRFRGDPTEIFIEAVSRFWELAQKRGLS